MDLSASSSPRTALHCSAAVLSFDSFQHPRAAVSEPTPFTPADDGAALREAEAAELAALLTASAAGDARAFENFYHLTVRHASAVVRRIVGDNHLEDVLSDTYFQAWREAARFEAQRGSARGWLLSMARSRALDRLRQESVRHGGLQGAPDPSEREDEDHGQPGPDALLESTEARTQLHAAVARLSANERWVLGLAYFRDLNHSEIAALTELPLGPVKSRISRAQHKLRDTLCARASMNRAAF
jgi:RNA polymerase sigma-70 factor, ECF subfamily